MEGGPHLTCEHTHFHKHAHSRAMGLPTQSPELQGSEEQRVLSHCDQLVGFKLSEHTILHKQTHSLHGCSSSERYVAMVMWSDVTAPTRKGAVGMFILKTFIHTALNDFALRKCKSPHIFLYCSSPLNGSSYQPLHFEDYSYWVPRDVWQYLGQCTSPCLDLAPQKHKYIFLLLQQEEYHQKAETWSQNTVTLGREDIHIYPHAKAGT